MKRKPKHRRPVERSRTAGVAQNRPTSIHEHPTTVEYEVAESFEQARDELPRRIADSVAQFRGQLQQLPPLEFLALVSLMTFTGYKDGSDDIIWQFAEFPTWIYKIDGIPSVNGPLAPQAAIRAQSLLHDLINLSNTATSIRSMDREPSAARHLQFKHASSAVNVRQPTFHLQHRAHLAALFRHLEREVRGRFRLTVDDMLACEATIMSHINESLGDIYRQANETYARLEPALRRRRVTLEPHEQELVTHILEVGTPSQRPDMLRRLITVGVSQLAVSVLTLSSRTLCTRSGAPSAEVLDRFLELFSSARESQIGDSLPGLYEPLERRPMLRLSDGTVYANLFPKIIWAIKPVIERQLHDNERFKRVRSDFLESRVTTLFSQVLPGASVHRGVEYAIGSEKGELDCLVAYDRTLFLCECKSGSMSFPARRGAPSVMEDLQRLVGEANDQGLRALRFVHSAETVIFDGDSQQIPLSHLSFERVIVMAVTLDYLGSSFSRVVDLQDAGLIEKNVLPWLITYADLEILTTILASPTQLLHYITRRLRPQNRSVEAFDELVFLGAYLSTGLYFEDNGLPDCDVIHLASHFDKPIVAFYQKRLNGIQVEPPTQSIPATLGRLIDALEETSHSGRSEVGLAILEGGAETRALLAKRIHESRKRARITGWSGMRVGIGDTIFVYAAFSDRDHHGADSLVAYCNAAKLSAPWRRVVGVQQHADTLAIVDVRMIGSDSSLDNASEKAARELLARLRTHEHEPH